MVVDLKKLKKATLKEPFKKCLYDRLVYIIDKSISSVGFNNIKHYIDIGVYGPDGILPLINEKLMKRNISFRKNKDIIDLPVFSFTDKKYVIDVVSHLYSMKNPYFEFCNSLDEILASIKLYDFNSNISIDVLTNNNLYSLLVSEVAKRLIDNNNKEKMFFLEGENTEKNKFKMLSFYFKKIIPINYDVDSKKDFEDFLDRFYKEARIRYVNYLSNLLSVKFGLSENKHYSYSSVEDFISYIKKIKKVILDNDDLCGFLGFDKKYFRASFLIGDIDSYIENTLFKKRISLDNFNSYNYNLLKNCLVEIFPGEDDINYLRGGTINEVPSGSVGKVSEVNFKDKAIKVSVELKNNTRDFMWWVSFSEVKSILPKYLSFLIEDFDNLKFYKSLLEQNYDDSFNSMMKEEFHNNIIKIDEFNKYLRKYVINF